MKDQPFAVPLLGLLSGIYSGQFLPEDSRILFALILSGIFVLFISFRTLMFRFVSPTVFLFFAFLGIVRLHHHNSVKHLDQKFLHEKEWVKLKIGKPYRSTDKYRKHKSEILSIDSQNIGKTNALLYWKKENPPIKPGDEIWVYARIRATEPPKNPHQFDYKKYLQRQQIHYILYSGSIYWIEKKGKNLYSHFGKFKSDIRKKLLLSGYSQNATDIIGAMLLGDRTEMDEEIEENYRKTGVVHILSISGLHVVMVYSIFYFVLYPIVYIPKGKIWRIICSLICIWLYAVFVEIEPPVARSALMISVYYLAMVFRRKPNIYHTLAVSAFILILANPNFIWDVGFQLSYAAVFFIVWLMPVYRKILPLKNSRLTYIRDFVGTSISAQAGTFPIAAYYFHQSSGLFLAGNVLMIPASFLMISGGMFSVLLCSFHIELQLWTRLFNGFFRLCNEYIGWLSSHENLVFENVSLDLAEVFILILIFATFRFLVLKLAPKYLFLMFILLVFFEINRFYKAHQSSQRQEIIVFYQYRNSVIGIRDGQKFDVYVSDETESEKLFQYVIKPYVIQEGVQTVNRYHMEAEKISEYTKTKNLIIWKGKRILIANRNLNLRNKDFDYILIQNSSDINLDSISKSTEIILDGSNFPNYLINVPLPVWRTAESGFKRITP